MRMFGVSETKGENTDEIMINIAKEELGVHLRAEDIDRSHRVGAAGRENVSHRQTTQSNRHGASSETSETSSPSSSQTWSSIAANAQASQSSRPRPIIIKFASYRVRQAVLRARRRLKKTGISIAEDLTKANYDILRTARSASGVASAWSQDGRIFVAIPSSNGKTSKKLITSVDDAKRLK